MEAVSYSTFRNHLKTYLRRVNENSEPLIVTNTNPDDNVVVLSKDDYDSMMETMRIVQNPALHAKIVKGLQSIQNGETKPRQLLEE